MTTTPPKLLKPKDVAEILKVSVKTVYKHQRRLCGFHPAGIGCLRFRQEDIYNIIEHSFRMAELNQIESKSIKEISRKRLIPSKKYLNKSKDPNRYGLLD